MRTLIDPDHKCRCGNKIIINDFVDKFCADIFIMEIYCADKKCPNHEGTLLASPDSYPSWAQYLP